MVIELPKTNGGPSKVTYLPDVPTNGWTDVHKTDQLVLRRILRGSFADGVGEGYPPITDDFYIGVFEVTVGQAARLSSSTPDDKTNSVVAATLEDDFGKIIGNYETFLTILTYSIDPNDWPATNTLAFALPPAAQWEYACRAGTSTLYYHGNTADNLTNYAWFVENSGSSVQNVGQLTTNAWGLYDMLGNVGEVVGEGVFRGGNCTRSASFCTCTFSDDFSSREKWTGFRVYLEVPTAYFSLTLTNGTQYADAGDTNGTHNGTGSYTNGHIVTIWADAPPTNQVFDCWIGDVGNVDDVKNAETTLTMPQADITIEATYRTNNFSLTVLGGTGSGNYEEGQVVSITATNMSDGQPFVLWIGDVRDVVADVWSAETTLIMPKADITVEAVCTNLPKVTVVNGIVEGTGTGIGYYWPGATVTVTANTTNSAWRFDKWAWAGDITITNPTSNSVTFVMPESDVTLTATYEQLYLLTLTYDGSPYYSEWLSARPNENVVTISAPAPPPLHHSFRWQGSVLAEDAVADLTATNTLLTMKTVNITLAATYPFILYPVTVTDGNGSGHYQHGAAVPVSAAAAPSALHVFDRWVGDTHLLANPLAENTILTVDVAARVMAAYRPVPMVERTYLVVDLAAGASSYTNEPPAGGWNTDVYKTSAMVFRKIPAGEFTMGGNTPAGWPATAHPVKLTEAFYMGLFPVTQAQWRQAAGWWPNCVFSGAGREMRPVEWVSYAALRGAVSGAQWPVSADIDSGSFIATMRSKAGSGGGFGFDLPTEAQWEYVCRAGTTTDYSFGDNAAALGNYAWFGDQAGTTHPVGEKLPNSWGFYDMHGNVNEWCLDWFSGDYETGAQKDPKGAGGSPLNSRIVRGGSWIGMANECLSATRYPGVVTNTYSTVGFRLAWTLGVEHSFAVTNGIVNTNGLFIKGIQIPITAEHRNMALKFLRWEVLPPGTSLGATFNANHANTVVTMPDSAVALTAIYQVDDAFTSVTVVNGNGSGSYTNGTVVTVTANAPEQWYEFVRWVGDTAGLANPSASATTLTANGGNVVLTATYKIMDPLPPDVHLLTTTGGGVTRTIPVQEGVTVPVTAPPPPSASFVFVWWEVAPVGISLGAGFNVNAPTTSLIMPSTDVALTAVYAKDPGPTPGYLNIRLVDSLTGANLLTAMWSADGKDFVSAASNYPLRPGSYTLSFRPPSLNWLTPAKLKVSIKAGQTATLTVSFVWVPVVTGIASGGGPGDTVVLSPASGQVVPGKGVTLTAKPSPESVFVEWTDGVAAASRLVAPATNATYTALFRLRTSYTTPPVLAPGTGTPVPTVGTLFSHSVGISERPATFKASKLPGGLKINSATGEIYGVPTKAGTFLVTVTATNPNNLSANVTVMMTIAPLSPYAQGVFTGYLTNGTAEVAGVFTMKASAAGALSVKATMRGAAVSFSTKGWRETDGTVYTAQFLTKKGEALSLSVDTSAWGVSGFAFGGKIGADALELAGRWDMFKANKKSLSADYAFAMSELTKYQGYYTVALPVTACAMFTSGVLDNVQEGAGYLTLTVNKTGGVKLAGNLPDGIKLSASTTLLVTGAEAAVPVFAPLYSKRGAASGLLTVRPGATAPDGNRIAPDPAVAWQWTYPGKSVTAPLDGFAAVLEPFGAFYAKVATVESSYSGAAFTAAVNAVPLSIPLTFNAKGAASLTTDPTDNPVGAKLTVKPATGLFNGTFLRVAPGAAKAATVKYLGVLTRDGVGEPVGYGAYVLPETAKSGATSYSLKPSYPVVIE